MPNLKIKDCNLILGQSKLIGMVMIVSTYQSTNWTNQTFHGYNQLWLFDYNPLLFNLFNLFLSDTARDSVVTVQIFYIYLVPTRPKNEPKQLNSSWFIIIFSRTSSGPNSNHLMQLGSFQFDIAPITPMPINDDEFVVSALCFFFTAWNLNFMVSEFHSLNLQIFFSPMTRSQIQTI